tara:strand:- start:343 stop:621 length:279 start_codon:yes stop_codon:yes gene_type:complete
MKLSSIFIPLIFIGIIFITINIVKINNVCKEKIVYKYLPRNYKDEINNPFSVKDIFDELFKKKSPWASRIYSSEDTDINKILKKSKDNNITQ